MCLYIYIYIYHNHMCTYIYTYMYREQEKRPVPAVGRKDDGRPAAEASSNNKHVCINSTNKYKYKYTTNNHI